MNGNISNVIISSVVEHCHIYKLLKLERRRFFIQLNLVVTWSKTDSTHNVEYIKMINIANDIFIDGMKT
ncbi:hypothetical protein TXYLGN1_29860 [Tepidimicrobium xylanilyticum]|nr:hypothetical protein EN5CB1_05540 [Tepidimicrobium xylanilyticum]